MKILVIHNKYKQRGGEDAVVENETGLLRAAGHEVFHLVVSNDSIIGLRGEFRAAVNTVYSFRSRSATDDVVSRCKPDIVHVHNFFPMLSPSIFYACKARNVPTIMTLHNFRLLCANGLLLRDGEPCEKCVTGGVGWGVIHKCYRSSRIGSAVVATMIAAHQRVGTWNEVVTRFIALTDFSRSRFARANFPVEKISVKPNFIHDPNLFSRAQDRSGVVFCGRLSKEKGVDVLLDAWKNIDAELTVIGDGPMADELRSRNLANVRFLGQINPESVHLALRSARALVVPSLWYENFPLVVVEAMAVGTPVIASRLGALSEIVRNGETGLLFAPGNVADLTRIVQMALGHASLLPNLGQGARRFYERYLTPRENLRILEEVYTEALDAS